MNPEQKKNCEILRSMGSPEAANWLLEEYRPSGLCFYVSKRSWSKREQIRLTEYFLSLMPHASEKCYESLLVSVPVPLFVKIATEKISKMNTKDFDLIKYYLPGSVKKFCKNQRDLDSFAALKEVLKLD